MSASAPAGSVKRKKGRVAKVDMRERKSGDGAIVFINQVAAMSYADTALPDSRLAPHKLRKVRFLREIQIEVISRERSRTRNPACWI
jgi:hypothetical protein